MGFQICWVHNKVTTWGCPDCRDERMKNAIEQDCKDFRQVVNNLFKDMQPVKVRLRNEEPR